MKAWKQERYCSLQMRSRPWQKWFAWRPVKTVSDKWVWQKYIYRKHANDYSDYEDWTWYFYADDFDILKEPNDRNGI